jgi:hypothetical protein
MEAAEVLEHLPVTTWHGPFDAEMQRRAMAALEHGKVLVLPDLPFQVQTEEADLLRSDVSGEERKNVSLDPATRKLGNVALPPREAARIAAMMQRFADGAAQLLADLLPHYAGALERARTSFRPMEIAGRTYSARHDDRRLHVDAFPSRPQRGRRILRLFSNVAPDGAARAWHVGEPFELYAKRFFPLAGRPLLGSAWLFQRLGITKGRRSEYDHIMLGLHDKGKLDAAYQVEAAQANVTFLPGTTWMCFTDQVLHAALSGHCALEQTFHLPVAAMSEPACAPLRVLEHLAGRALV